MPRKKRVESAMSGEASSTSGSSRTVLGVEIPDGSDADALHKTYYAELSRKLEWSLWSTLAAGGALKGSFKSWANRTADMVLIRWAAKRASQDSERQKTSEL